MPELDIYGGSLALCTDLYQLSMACGYWKAGHSEREAVFHLTYRRPPFGGGYAIYDSEAGLAGPALYDIEDPTRPVFTPAHETGEDLLVPMLEGGRVLRSPDRLEVARARAARELAQLSPRTRRFMNPQPYPVGLDKTVHTRKQQLIAAARGQR